MAKRHRNKAPYQPKPRNNQELAIVVYDPQQAVYTAELGKILQRQIDGVMKPYRKEWRRIINEKEFTPVSKSSKGKKKKSIEIAKETISFEFLRGQEELRRFPGIEEMFCKLDKWEIEGTKRDMNDTCDTYYSHQSLGTKKLRSVNEVVNHLLPEGYPKLHTKKEKKNVKELSRKRKKTFFLGSSSSSQKTGEIEVSTEVQIIIPSDDGALEHMLKNIDDKAIEAVDEGKNMDEAFPDYEDLPNEFFK